MAGRIAGVGLDDDEEEGGFASAGNDGAGDPAGPGDGPGDASNPPGDASDHADEVAAPLGGGGGVAASCCRPRS